MQSFHKKKSGLHRLILFILAALIIIIAVGFAFGKSEQEQQEMSVSSCADALLPEVKITEVNAREIKYDAAETEIAEEPTEAVEPEIEIEAPAEPTEEVIEEPDFEPYDIPLSAELQLYTFDLCEERGLDFEIVLALMYAESSYRPNIISRTNDYGLMQLNRVNHKWLRAELGITDFLDAEQNIDAGTFLLMNISEKYPDTHKMLMAYNFGEAGAKRHWNNGVYSSGYSRKIVAKADEIRNSNSAH